MQKASKIALLGVLQPLLQQREQGPVQRIIRIEKLFEPRSAPLAVIKREQRKRKQAVPLYAAILRSDEHQPQRSA